MNTVPRSDRKDAGDEKQAEHGLKRHEGRQRHNHRFLQPAPLFFTEDKHPLHLVDMFRGRSAFLICSGPSFLGLDHTKLRQPGIVTMGLNNSPRTFRPNLWTSVDSPDHWVKSIWLDPTIMKFVPLSHTEKRIFDSDKWAYPGLKVADCPNIIYYKRNEHFQARQWLWEDTFNWGNHKDYGGGRSIMLAAIRILFVLGFRRVYLLGCDFNMSPESKYHFDQGRHKGAIHGNNDTYRKLNGWFKELRPLFEKEGFHVLNCNPNSGLKSFDFISFEDAIHEAMSHFHFTDVTKERTRGLYDTETREKEEGIGREPTWVRLNNPRGLKRCRYCGKKCWRVSGFEDQPGKCQIRMGCEKSRQKLWQKKGNRYHGDLADVGTALLPEAEAVGEFNRRFGQEDKPK